MSNFVCHPYHMVNESPWPLLGSLGGLFLTRGIVVIFHTKEIILFFIGLILLIIVIYQWWRDVTREGALQGKHTSIVELGLRSGILLFIVSEVFFFLRFFWAYFHFSLRPSIEVGSLWPYYGIEPFNAFKIPFLNTIILLSSGVSVTWAHHAILKNNYNEIIVRIIITVLLGLYFTILQALEYLESMFCLSDGVYGSTFFIATGFHGLHVIVGTLFLLVCLIRIIKNEFNNNHHFGLEAAAWYWHFVDVVWLFLFISIYWWGRI